MKPSRVGSPAVRRRIRNDSLENGHSHTGGHIFVYDEEPMIWDEVR